MRSVVVVIALAMSVAACHSHRKPRPPVMSPPPAPVIPRMIATNACEVTMNADRTVIAPYFGE